MGGGGVLPTDEQGHAIKTEVRYWHGEWENERGDPIIYDLNDNRRANAKRGVITGYATCVLSR